MTKKIKLFSMCILCLLSFGLICVGVYSIAGPTNYIKGNIKITTPVEITMSLYKDSYDKDNPLQNLLDTENGTGNIKVESGQLKFSTFGANTAEEVETETLVVVFSTSSNEKLIIDTETIESINGPTTSNLMFLTKYHKPGDYNKATELAHFTSGLDYEILCTFKLAVIPSLKESVEFTINFNIKRMSEWQSEGNTGINGINYLYFGEYPQAKATTAEIADFTTPIGTPIGTFSAYDDTTGGFRRRELYMDSKGDRYVRVISDSTFYETAGYFKIQPLKWLILAQEDTESADVNNQMNTLVVCDVAIEQVMYQNHIIEQDEASYVKGENDLPFKDDINDENYVYANNYKYSNLRKFLIGEKDTETGVENGFYYSAFNDFEKQLISITEVDNSKNTLEQPVGTYASRNTNDYIFALSQKDLKNQNYGYQSSARSYLRMTPATAYADATGAGGWPDGFKDAQGMLEWYKTNATSFTGETPEDVLIYLNHTLPEGVTLDMFAKRHNNSTFCLTRSAGTINSTGCTFVHYYGSFQGYSTTQKNTCVVPAMHLSLK